jgi:hypothetical protein
VLELFGPVLLASSLEIVGAIAGRHEPRQHTYQRLTNKEYLAKSPNRKPVRGQDLPSQVLPFLHLIYDGSCLLRWCAERG